MIAAPTYPLACSPSGTGDGKPLTIDRLMHRAEVVRIDGDSYRAKEAQEREAARGAQRAAKAQAPRSRKAVQ